MRFRIAIRRGRDRGTLRCFLLLELTDNLGFFPRQFAFTQPSINARERDMRRKFFWINGYQMFEQWPRAREVTALQQDRRGHILNVRITRF